MKNAKASEKAYTCLKGGWLCRAYRESLEESDSQNTELIEELKIEEKEFLDKAYEGFIVARESERFPIAGMDSPTLDYVLAVMSFERGKVDTGTDRNWWIQDLYLLYRILSGGWLRGRRPSGS